jgi:flagellar biosynthesis protein FlhA
VVGELIPVGLLQRVLKNLLKDQIPIRELTAILECLGENASRTKNSTVLTELVRKRLSRTITERHRDESGKIPAIALDPALEREMISTLRQETEEMALALPAEMVMDISKQVGQAWKTAMDGGRDKVALLCDSRLRAPLATMLSRTIPPLPVVAYDEIALGADVEPIETVSIRDTNPQTAKQQELVGASS